MKVIFRYTTFRKRTRWLPVRTRSNRKIRAMSAISGVASWLEHYYRWEVDFVRTRSPLFPVRTGMCRQGHSGVFQNKGQCPPIPVHHVRVPLGQGRGESPVRHIQLEQKSIDKVTAGSMSLSGVCVLKERAYVPDKSLQGQCSFREENVGHQWSFFFFKFLSEQEEKSNVRHFRCCIMVIVRQRKTRNYQGLFVDVTMGLMSVTSGVVSWSYMNMGSMSVMSEHVDKSLSVLRHIRSW